MEVENYNSESALPGKGSTGSKGEGSIFSQNLELDFQPAPRPRQSELPDLRDDHSDPAERRTYFQIEAGKVADLLREELERFSDKSRDMELVEDLWRSWQALWGSGSDIAQQEFFSLFDIARQAFGAASRREQPDLSGQEKMALSRLLQGMDRLAGGRAGSDDIQWCRESGNRVARMVAAWVSEGLRQEEKPSRPAPSAGIPDDISGSIDEWFSQVSKFIPQSPDEGIDFGADLTIRADGEETAADEPQAPETVPEWHAALEDSGEADEPQVELEETADEILAAAENEGWELQVADEPARTELEADEHAELESGTISAEDIVIEGTSEGWLAEMYFGECCLDVVEAIHNNVDRLEGSGAARTVSGLLERVGYLIQLSRDFGLSEVDSLLGSLHARLEAISSAGRNDRSGDARRVEELLSTVGELERECEVCATPAW